jgi:translation initiation factor 3 subunit H
MADTIQQVQVEALAVMKIIKHARETYPTVATGCIVGLDVNTTLEITNCFPFPTVDPSASESSAQQTFGSSDNTSSSAAAAAAAPRAKANGAYQTEMIKYLREVNIDANNVGWYSSTSMGNFVNINTIENQFFYQKEMNEKTVALVYDGARSAQGSLSLRAFRLSPAFVSAFQDSKFTVDS